MAMIAAQANTAQPLLLLLLLLRAGMSCRACAAEGL
jgi:hypothetical protein